MDTPSVHDFVSYFEKRSKNGLVNSPAPVQHGSASGDDTGGGSMMEVGKAQPKLTFISENQAVAERAASELAEQVQDDPQELPSPIKTKINNFAQQTYKTNSRKPRKQKNENVRQPRNKCGPCSVFV